MAYLMILTLVNLVFWLNVDCIETLVTLKSVVEIGNIADRSSSRSDVSLAFLTAGIQD